MAQEKIIINATDLVLGKLSNIVAKELLLGKEVRILSSEKALITGNWRTALGRIQEFFNKRTNYNPTKGPFHNRAPSEIIKRAIRRKLPKKTFRGQEAYKRLKAFEGVPNSFRGCESFSIESASRYTSIKPTTSVVELGRLAGESGWKKRDVLEKLERKRGNATNTLKKENDMKRAQRIEKMNELATSNKRFAEIKESLEKLGY